MQKHIKITVHNIGNCCTTLILGTKTQNSIKQPL